MPHQAPPRAKESATISTRAVRPATPRAFRAIVRSRAGVAIERRPRLPLRRTDDVRLRVAYAGLCRTDVYAANALIPCAEPVVLGHEFSAIVDEVGPEVAHVAPGDRVAVFPWIGCGRCDACAHEMPQRCERAQMLGIDRDGAFAESVIVPAAGVYPIPDSLSLRLAAYAEPVAAALAILNADIRPTQRGLVLGAGRIADLTRLILHHHHFDNVTSAAHVPASTPAGARYDFAIETRADDLEPLCAALRPGGLLILKSRPAEPSSFPHALAVRKELRLHAVNYAPFRKALALLPALAPTLDTMIADPAPLDHFERLFALESRTEDHKLMFELAGEG